MNGDSSSSADVDNSTEAGVSFNCPVEGSSLMKEEEEADDSSSESVAAMMHVAMVYGTALITVRVSCGGRVLRGAHKFKSLDCVGSSH